MTGHDPGSERLMYARGLLDVEVVRDEAGEAVGLVRGELDRHPVPEPFGQSSTATVPIGR